MRQCCVRSLAVATLFRSTLYFTCVCVLYGRVQARAGKLLGVMGTDVPLKEITKLTPQYKVFRYAISQSMVPEF